MKPIKRMSGENYQPKYVSESFKVIMGSSMARKPPAALEPHSGQAAAGREPVVDLMTLVQLPAIHLREMVAFYVDVLGLSLEYPDRPLEVNSFVNTVPRIGPGLHILETPESEFRHLHGATDRPQQEYIALYVKSIDELHLRLQQTGTRMIAAPANGYLSFVDPEGHLIGVHERTDSEINGKFQSNITGFRHVQMYVSDLEQTAVFFEEALGFERCGSGHSPAEILMSVPEVHENQPMIRLVQSTSRDPQPMHWMLHNRPKHALELHSKNIKALRERIIRYGGRVKEDLEFTGCGGYLKFYTPDGHYLWVNQNRSYCDY